MKLVNKVTSVSSVPTVILITTIHTDKVVNTFPIDITENYVCREQKQTNTQDQNISSNKVKGTISEKRK